MTDISLLTIAPIIYKFAKDALIKDNDHYYGLQFNCYYGSIKTDRFPAFDYEDDLFVVQRVNENTSQWWIKAFEPEKKYWGGTSNLPDGGTHTLDCLFRASLFHDCGYSKAEAISKATGIPVRDLLAFFDDCFKILSEGYGAKKAVTKPVHWFLRSGGYLYHQIMKLFAVIVLALTIATGCYSVRVQMLDDPPEVHWTGPFSFDTTNKLDTTTNLPGHSQNDSAPTNEYISIPSVPNQPVTPEVPPIAFQIESFGSPNCSKAKEVSEAQIKDLKISKNGLTYRWVAGGCEKLGASSASDYSQTLAVAGYGDGKTFKAAKFDWISTDRLTRSFENIYDHYNGFDPDKFFSAKHRCFFIMSKDGKKRTNILTD